MRKNLTYIVFYLTFAVFSCSMEVGEKKIANQVYIVDSIIPDRKVKSAQEDLFEEVRKDGFTECYEDFDLFASKPLKPIDTTNIPEAFIKLLKNNDTLGFITFHKNTLDVLSKKNEYQASSHEFIKDGRGASPPKGYLLENKSDSMYVGYVFKKEFILRITRFVFHKYEMSRREMIVKKIYPNGDSEEVSLFKDRGGITDIVDLDLGEEAFHRYSRKIGFIQNGYSVRFISTRYNRLSEKSEVERIRPASVYETIHNYSYYPNNRFSVFWNIFIGFQKENGD